MTIAAFISAVSLLVAVATATAEETTSSLPSLPRQLRGGQDDGSIQVHSFHVHELPSLVESEGQQPDGSSQGAPRPPQTSDSDDVPSSSTQHEQEYLQFGNTRINNGVQADVGEYPFFSQMWWNNQGEGCGGSLIASRWVLTAAHCVEKFVADIETTGDGFPEWRVGSLCTNRPDNCGSPVQLVKSKRGLLSPNYDSVNVLWDYAVIELQEEVTSNIVPVTLDDGTKFQTFHEGYELRGIGMGLVNNIFTSFPTRLQEVNNKFLPRDECSEYFSTGPFFDESIMCTNGLNYGMCSGDSGSPVLVPDPSTPTGYLQVAVTSFGAPFCEDHDYPDGSAPVGTALSWIKSVVCPTYGRERRPSFCDPLGKSDRNPSAPPPSDRPNSDGVDTGGSLSEDDLDNLAASNGPCVDATKFFDSKKRKNRRCAKIKKKDIVKYCGNTKRGDAPSKCRVTCGKC